MISGSRALLHVPAAAGLDPGVLEEMLDRAVAWVETQTGRYFGAPLPVTEYLTGTGGADLYLGERPRESEDPDTPLVTVTEQCAPGATPTAVTGFAVRASRYDAHLRRTDGQRWTLGAEYAVSYQRGYEVDHGPPDIEQLLLDWVALGIGTRGAEGLQSESLAGYSYERASGISTDPITQLPGARATLAAWRRLVIA